MVRITYCVVEVPSKKKIRAIFEIIHQILDGKDGWNKHCQKFADVIDHGIVLTGGRLARNASSPCVR